MAKPKKKKNELLAEGVVCRNKQARFKYEIAETMEAGMELLGSEVKSLREGEGNLQDSFAVVKNGEVWLLSSYIPPYGPSTLLNHDPYRKRKLLLHRYEIKKLEAKLTEKGLTLVPLSIYFTKRGIAKCELALARGKKLFDKRESIKKRDADREIQRRLRVR